MSEFRKRQLLRWSTPHRRFRAAVVTHLSGWCRCRRCKLRVRLTDGGVAIDVQMSPVLGESLARKSQGQHCHRKHQSQSRISRFDGRHVDLPKIRPQTTGSPTSGISAPHSNAADCCSRACQISCLRGPPRTRQDRRTAKPPRASFRSFASKPNWPQRLSVVAPVRKPRTQPISPDGCQYFATTGPPNL